MSLSKTVRIAIDLTPMKPRGENGGAKVFILTLIKELANLEEKEFEYLLITETWNHEEIMGLERNNVKCLKKSELIEKSGIAYYVSAAVKKFLFIWVRVKYYLVESISGHKISSSSGPDIVKKFLENLLNSFVTELFSAQPILRKNYDIDLLFCPFSAPSLSERGLPLVSIVYDFQHLEIPSFFTTEERIHRNLFFQDLSKQSNSIVAISEFSKTNFLKYFDFPAQKVFSIPISIYDRLVPLPNPIVNETLEKLNIDKNSYLFFPANFWPHKNHDKLIKAYSIYRNKCQDIFLDLVFTGDIENLQSSLKDIVCDSNYSSSIHFLGFLDQQNLVAVWQGCEALIFPSLYEGFGIPLLEAMWFNKPIICSNIDSLIEVGGDAALYFDPYDPEEIAKAIIKISCDKSMRYKLAELGQERLKLFNRYSMAQSYLEVFKDALSSK